MHVRSHAHALLRLRRRWLSGLEEEFFRQGDKEKELGLPISPLFDRTKQGVSKGQVGFYEFVALPLAHALASAFPGALPLFSCFIANYNHWCVHARSGSNMFGGRRYGAAGTGGRWRVGGA